MSSLDEQTLEALAELICGDNGPVYRRGWELSSFFRRAGLPCPDHDGSTRKTWTLARLREVNRSPSQIELVVSRLANPREYRGSAEATSDAIQRINQVLAVEGMEVLLHGVEPQLVTKSPGMVVRAPTTQVPDSPPDFVRLARDKSLADILTRRWEDAQRCVDAQAFVPAIVTMGSLLEGLLLAIVHNRPAQANWATCCPKNGVGKPRPHYNWHLIDLINVAHECGWIQRDVRDFSQSLREYRNIVHPWHQRGLGIEPDEDTCTICWEVVRAAINDIMQIQ